jgi:hypothetical protein
MWLNQDTHLHTSITLATNIHKKSTKNIVITHCPKVLLFSLSPKRFNAERGMGYAKKIYEEIKRQVPGDGRWQ